MTEVLEDWEEDFEEFDLEDESEDERVAAIDEESDRFERGAGVEPTDEMAAHWHPDRLVWHHPGEFAQLRNELALAGDDLELDVRLKEVRAHPQAAPSWAAVFRGGLRPPQGTHRGRPLHGNGFRGTRR
jgi:hypothetical protein